MVEVWAKFMDWCEKDVLRCKIGCIVAGNSKGSDMKFLWVVIVRKHIQQLAKCLID
jgi:hypothetical protein